MITDEQKIRFYDEEMLRRKQLAESLGYEVKDDIIIGKKKIDGHKCPCGCDGIIPDMFGLDKILKEDEPIHVKDDDGICSCTKEDKE